MSFINTIFLFGAAAAVVPVLIHLVRRMKARTVPFSSLMFLKATPKELVRRRRLRDKLLMAARASLIALLALVFARPYVPAEKIPLVSTRESESVVLLIDRSFSMQYEGAFARALEAARERMARAAGGDEFAVIAFDEEVQLLADLDSDPAVRQASMEALEPGYRATDFFPPLQRAEDVLKDARNNRRVVVLISDFQDAGWTGTLDNWKLQDGITFEPLVAASGAGENSYVEAFELSRRSLGAEGLVRYDARISSTDDPRDRAIRLTLDGAEVERQMLSSGRASTSFQQILSREGYHQGHVSLDEDALPVDDRYYFTDRFEGLPGILIVGEGSDGFFIRNAFDLGETSRFRVTLAQQVTTPALRRNDVAFVSKQLREPERRALLDFAQEGGTVVLSSGASSDPAGLSATLEAMGLGRVEQIVDTRSQLGYEAIIGDVDLRHPIFEPFAGGGSAAILRPRFRRFARFTPAEGTQVIGRFDSGEPFLSERAVGIGRAFFYASTFGTGWTDLPLDEMFIPLLYEIVEYGSQRSDVKNNVTVGEPVAISGRAGGTVEVRTPDGKLYRVDLDEDGRGFFRQTDIPGHYTASGDVTPAFFSANVDRRESNLTSRSPDEVYAAVTPPPKDAPTTPAEAAAVVEDEEKDQKLWRSLLLIVLALFAVETYAANRKTARTAGRRNGDSADFRGKAAPKRRPRTERQVAQKRMREEIR